jgi:hypothetical protein
MKYILKVAFIAIAFIAVFSCEKRDIIPAFTPVPSQNYEHRTLLDDGGDDDDDPIIMHKVKTQANTPLQAATVTMIHGTDSVQLVTDSAGECVFHLQNNRNWQLKIDYPGYQPIDMQVYLPDSFTVKTSVLDQQ